MNEWMNEQSHEWRNEWINELINLLINKLKDFAKTGLMIYILFPIKCKSYDYTFSHRNFSYRIFRFLSTAGFAVIFLVSPITLSFHFCEKNFVLDGEKKKTENYLDDEGFCDVDLDLLSPPKGCQSNFTKVKPWWGQLDPEKGGGGGEEGGELGAMLGDHDGKQMQ